MLIRVRLEKLVQNNKQKHKQQEGTFLLYSTKKIATRNVQIVTLARCLNKKISRIMAHMCNTIQRFFCLLFIFCGHCGVAVGVSKTKPNDCRGPSSIPSMINIVNKLSVICCGLDDLGSATKLSVILITPT